jgi:hypothetical protein
MKAAQSLGDLVGRVRGSSGLSVLIVLFWQAFTSFGCAETAVAAVPGIETAFESRITRLPTPADQAVAEPREVSWTYVNHWEFPLVIERFEESCTCLRGRSDGLAVGPGKSGTIRANFSAGSYRGLVRKSLHVRFVGHAKSVELVAETRIPSSVQLSRHDLVWEHGAGDTIPNAKTIDITAGTPMDFRITALRGIVPGEYTVESETLISGRHYRLTITPVAAPTAGTRCLQIRTDSTDPRDRVLAVFLRTEAKPASSETSTRLHSPTGS